MCGFKPRHIGFKAYLNACGRRLSTDAFGLEHDVVKTWIIHFLPDFDQVAVSALHQTIHRLHHVLAGVQSSVERTHL